jgi:hydroxypyruvate isomerase
VPRFSANLSFLYQDLPFLDRFDAAARDGFLAVEYMAPYSETPAAIAETLKRNRLTQALFNVPSGDWDGGERGIACLPDRVEDFRAGVGLALEYAAPLGCKRLNALAGLAPQGADPAALTDTLVDNLRWASARCAEAGVALLIEPINTRDIPGFFLSTTAQAEGILDRVGSDNLFIQYDFYHMQVMQGDLVPTFARLQRRIAHVQVADTPGRHEPGTGEINYPFVFAELDRLGYGGWVGCEYKPKAGTSAGLGWMKPYPQERPVA